MKDLVLYCTGLSPLVLPNSFVVVVINVVNNSLFQLVKCLKCFLIYVSHHDDQIHALRYPFLLYIIALATFINIITAISNIIRIRKFHSPELKSSKISVLLPLSFYLFLQTMMMKEYGSADIPQKLLL